MSSYIQINIYNETLLNLRTRGIDLNNVLQQIGCQDNAIIEIPIPSSIPSSSTPHKQVNPFKSISTEIVNIGVSPSTSNANQNLKRVSDDILIDQRFKRSKESTPSISESNDTLCVPKEDDSAYDLLPENSFDIFDVLFKNETVKQETPEKPAVKKRVFSKEYMEILDQVHQIHCEFENCNHVYSWKVKYGKLRLVDHALTHIEEKRLPCHLCGVLVQNVRQIRNHYNKDHPEERPIGYGMKDMPIDDNELRHLWRKCYGNKIDIIGEASSVGNEKMRRIAKKKTEDMLKAAKQEFELEHEQKLAEHLQKYQNDPEMLVKILVKEETID